MKIFKYQKKFFYCVSIIFVFLNLIHDSFAGFDQPILSDERKDSFLPALDFKEFTGFIEVEDKWVCNDSNMDKCSIEVDAIKEKTYKLESSKQIKICIKWEVSINYNNPKKSIFRCKTYKKFTQNDEVFEGLKEQFQKRLSGECHVTPKVENSKLSCFSGYSEPDGEVKKAPFGSSADVVYVVSGLYKDTNNCKANVNEAEFRELCSDFNDATGYVCWDYGQTFCKDSFDPNNFYLAIGVECQYRDYYVDKERMYCQRLSSVWSYNKCIYRKYTCVAGGTYRRDLTGYEYFIGYRDIKGLRFRDDKILSLYDPNMLHETNN